jgi:hypothetical protein
MQDSVDFYMEKAHTPSISGLTAGYREPVTISFYYCDRYKRLHERPQSFNSLVFFSLEIHLHPPMIAPLVAAIHPTGQEKISQPDQALALFHFLVKAGPSFFSLKGSNCKLCLLVFPF